MSLINQMLRDLQEQKKGGAQASSEPPRRSKMEKIPYLPMPVVLGGAGLLLIFFLWWMAGVLSDLMFGFEPSTSKTETQQVASIEESTTTADLNTSFEKDQLTLAERNAEPPMPAVVSEPVTSEDQAPDKVRVKQKKSLVKVASAEPEVVKKAPVVKPTSPKAAKRKQKKVPVRTAAKIRTQKAPVKVVTKAPVRLHPDELPGAVRSRSVAKPEAKMVERPSRAPATTPYGMAEEAYLDGRWAFERERANLAMRSLQEALKLYPGHLPARELLVKILSKSGKNGEAMFLLAEGLEIAPDYPVFKKAYARLLVEQGDYDAATKVMLNGGLPTVEDDPEAHVVLASLYQRLDEPFLAAQTYRNLLVAWPQTGAFWVGLGGALEGQHLSKEAAECYQKALKTKNLRKDLLAYARKRLSVLN
jgi:Tfp pilus assembly protein PilF/cytoskeletal protein RodZ